MSDGKVIIDSKLDDDGLSVGLKKIQAKLKGFDASLIRTAALGSAISIAPALVPVIASATAATLALGSAFMAAGVGIAGFGAVAVSNLKAVFEGTGNLTAAQQEARDNLEGFKSYWSSFAKEFEEPVLNSFNSSLTFLKSLLDLSKPAIQGASKAVESLLESLNKSMGTSQVQAFFEYIGNTAQGHIESFGKIAGNSLLGFMNLMVAFAPLADSVMQGLVNMTSSFAEWTATLSKSAAFQNFISYVQENGPKVLELIGNLGSIIISLGTALAPLGKYALDFLNNLTGLAAALVDGNPVINGFLQGMVNSLPKLYESGLQIILSVITGITEALPQVISAGLQTSTKMFETLIENLPLFIDAGLQLVKTLADSIVNSLPEIVNAITIILEGFVSTVAYSLPKIINTGVDILLSLIDGLVKTLPDLVKTTVDLVSKIVETVLQNLPKIIESGIKVLNALIDGIISILPDLLETAKTLVTKVMETIVENLPLIIDSGIKLLNSLIDGIIKILPDLIVTTWDLVETMVKAIADNLPKILESGVKLLKALIDGILRLIPQLGSTILNDVIPEILDNLSSIVPDMLQIGKNIIQGLINGVLSMASSLVKSVKGVVNDAIEGAKNLLGIHSPSRVFMEIGEFTGEGFAIGMKNMKNDILKASQMMANVSTTPFKSPNYVQSSQTPLEQVSNQPITLQLVTEGRVLAEQTYPDINRMLYNDMNIAARTGGTWRRI